MTDAVDAQESLEAVLKDEIIRMYQDVADRPEAEYHFYHGREAAELFGYDPAWLDRADGDQPKGTVVRMPARDEISAEVNEQLVVEFCSR